MRLEAKSKDVLMGDITSNNNELNSNNSSLDPKDAKNTQRRSVSRNTKNIQMALPPSECRNIMKDKDAVIAKTIEFIQE
jgi:hypothetical protein